MAKKVVLRREGEKWMAPVCHEIVALVCKDNDRAIGIDMNTGQVAVSDGQQARLLPTPDTRRLEARKRRHQRRLARHKRGPRRRERAPGGEWRGPRGGSPWCAETGNTTRAGSLRTGPAPSSSRTWRRLA
ncbi:MAG: hypothetical protein OXE86_02165 [Alphaproteobacteria bacterium]|nr:hypothetical protein [Alphaproteobacteria bacterium]